MATAAKKKSKPARKAGPRDRGAAKTAPTRKSASTVARADADADNEPERSAPPLAEVDGDVLEFIEALDRFKKRHNRPFPSWSEVLLVLRQLGYKRR